MIEFRGRRYILIPNTPVNPISEIDTIINPLVDHRYLAVNAKNSSGNPASNAQEVSTIPDVVGTRDLTYSGGNAELYGRKPLFYKQYGILSDFEGVHKSLDMVFMDNQVNIQYSGSDNTNRSFPRAKGRVWFQPEYFLYEAYDNNFNRPYFGENAKNYNTGITTLRFTTGEDWNNYLVVLSTNTLNYIYQEFIEDGQESAPDRISIKVWLNGVLLDGDNHHETYRRQPVTEGFGADTNCAMHGFIENFDVYGRTLSPGDRDTIWVAIRDYYKIGQVQNIPSAVNVGISNVSGIITGSYNYVHPLGYSEDVAGRETYWVSYAPGGGIQSGEVITALNNVISFNKADYPTKFNEGIRFNVRVKDSVDGFTNWLPGVIFEG